MRSGGRCRRPAAAALLCALAALLLAGCGTERAGSEAATATPIPWTTMQPAGVHGVRLSGDRTLLVETSVPSGAAACVRELKAVLTEPMAELARVQVTFVSPSGDRASGCTEEGKATAKLELPAPLDGRDVLVDGSAHFTAEGAKPPALRRCGELGCHPAPTGCTPASYQQAVQATDVPVHTGRSGEKCDGKWLVMDLSTRMGPACEGDPDPACSARQVGRWFYGAGETGWQPLTRTSAGGCRDVHRVEPAFPEALCATLEPPARQGARRDFADTP
ncbi:hypothetical protein [Streptomyces sp. NPDC047803]|uniref:hypothetical protein n=1 Tax=Streptomyces TaxID=1883 RepID=UPI0033E295DE